MFADFNRQTFDCHQLVHTSYKFHQIPTHSFSRAYIYIQALCLPEWWQVEKEREIYFEIVNCGIRIELHEEVAGVWY